ncbi:hypothetical protein D9M71_247460 [compost metagenome]
MGGLAALDLTGNTNPPANTSQPPPIANFLVSANLYKNLYKHERLYMYCEWPFTLYFDGACPLCAREIAFLRRQSTGGKLILVDISADDFDAGALGLTVEQLRSCLHGRFASGHWVTGLDATLWSWRAADVGLWVAPLAWRPLRPLFSVLYRLFCRLRPHLAWLPHPAGGHRCSGEESKCHIR